MHGYVNTEQYWTRSSGDKFQMKGIVKPFTEYRQISRGRHKGKFEVVIKHNGGYRKIIVKEQSVRRFPS